MMGAVVGVPQGQQTVGHYVNDNEKENTPVLKKKATKAPTGKVSKGLRKIDQKGVDQKDNQRKRKPAEGDGKKGE